MNEVTFDSFELALFLQCRPKTDEEKMRIHKAAQYFRRQDKIRKLYSIENRVAQIEKRLNTLGSLVSKKNKKNSTM